MAKSVIQKYKQLLVYCFFIFVVSGCNGGNSSAGGKPGDPPAPDEWPTPDISVESWAFAGGHDQHVAAAKLAGSYAVADSSALYVEIRDIRQELKHQINPVDIVGLLPAMDLSHSNALCGMTFTPSGRFLYLAMCDGSGGEGAILAYNLNTEDLFEFSRLNLSPEGERVGMHYFKSHLYVGSHDGVYRLGADRNAVFEQQMLPPKEKITLPDTVIDIALDTVEETIYLATTDSIYRLASGSSQATKVYENEGIIGITFSRVYGEQTSAGLYFARHEEEGTGLYHVSLEILRKSQTLAFQQYMRSPSHWQGLAMTADGALLYSDGQVYRQLEVNDQRLGFEAWMLDELGQYVAAIKGLTASDITGNTASPEGFLHTKLTANQPYTNSMADNVGWALYVLMIADKVSPDPQIEPLIELLIKRHAGLHEDGLGGLKNVDGHFVRNYLSDGQPNHQNPEMQVYTSMKFLPAVYKSAEVYPENENISKYLQYLRQTLKRSGDVIRAEQRMTWDSDDFGPKRHNRRMNNETWLFADIAAAQDPNATVNYGHYAYDRERFFYDEHLKGEAVIDADHPAFIVMGAPLILEHHYADEGWAEVNQNYYAATQAETDDHGFHYLAAFSAGFSPNSDGDYNADGPSNHPDNYIHFPAVLGFGQLGYLDAMVGGYHAYRDGRRQKMVSAGNSNIRLLSRWSMDMPDTVTTGLGLADFWFGAVGLAEAIKPGVTEQFRAEFFVPEPSWTKNQAGSQVVEFSAITPRLVSGVGANNQQTMFGYQRSPFIVPNGQHYSSFIIDEPLGDWVELDDVKGQLDGALNPTIRPRFTNPYFEQGLNGWEQISGNVQAVDSSLGKAAELAPVTGENANLKQAVYLPLALAGSEFSVTSLLQRQSNSGGAARVKLWWSNTANGSRVGNESIGVYDPAGADSQLVRSHTTKPDNASYLHIEYEVEGSPDDSYLFGNTSLFSFGAHDEFALVNGDFESGLNGWKATSNISIVTDPALVIEGSQSVRFDISSQLQRLDQAFDIANDPDGTRYIIRFNVGRRQLADSKFDVEVDIHHPDEPQPPGDENFMFWWDAAGVVDDSPDEVTLVMRKRPGESRFNIKFRLQKKGAQPSAGDFIIIDNVRVYKEQLFDINQCTGSITGC